MRNLRIVLSVAALTLGAAVISGACGHTAPNAGQPAVAARAGEQLVILDTDIGDDIDDAFALALVLRSPEFKLLGITTAYGDTELRARLVERYLGASVACSGLIPVIPGASTPQSNVFTQAAYARGDNGALVPCLNNTMIDPKENARLAEERSHHDAAGFLLRQVKAHPGEITLIAIGPLFNIEAAIKKDPDTFRKLKRVVLMGGSIHRGYDNILNSNLPAAMRTPSSEWNINRDPAGLRVLLASGVPVFMMPLDSTQIHLQAPERERIFSHGSALTDQLTLLYHQWSAGNEGHPDTPTLFDPVAVAYAIRPDLCPATPMRLEVDDKGFTKPVDGSPNAQVCLKSDEKGFLDLLLSRITSDPTH
jgi:inosine-uridine nucleoside N-ribohydrolase